MPEEETFFDKYKDSDKWSTKEAQKALQNIRRMDEFAALPYHKRVLIKMTAPHVLVLGILLIVFGILYSLKDDEYNALVNLLGNPAYTTLFFVLMIATGFALFVFVFVV